VSIRICRRAWEHLWPTILPDTARIEIPGCCSWRSPYWPPAGSATAERLSHQKTKTPWPRLGGGIQGVHRPARSRAMRLLASLYFIALASTTHQYPNAPSLSRYICHASPHPIWTRDAHGSTCLRLTRFLLKHLTACGTLPAVKRAPPCCDRPEESGQEGHPDCFGDMGTERIGARVRILGLRSRLSPEVTSGAR
jgi:hypothetical protein